MLGTGSPLVAIKEKEEELRRRLERAWEEAEARTAGAREEARSQVVEARREGKKRAEIWLQEDLKKARQDADAAVAAAERKAAAASHRGDESLQAAAAWVVDTVLPQIPGVDLQALSAQSLHARALEEQV